jgi:hypothetical protein
MARRRYSRGARITCCDRGSSRFRDPMEAQLEDWIKRVLRATMNWQLGNYIGADRDSYYGQLAVHRMLMKTWRKSKPLCRMWQKPNR